VLQCPSNWLRTTSRTLAFLLLLLRSIIPRDAQNLHSCLWRALAFPLQAVILRDAQNLCSCVSVGTLLPRAALFATQHSASILKPSTHPRRKRERPSLTKFTRPAGSGKSNLVKSPYFDRSR